MNRDNSHKFMNECLFTHKNNVRRSLLCKKNIKYTKFILHVFTSLSNSHLNVISRINTRTTYDLIVKCH